MSEKIESKQKGDLVAFLLPPGVKKSLPILSSCDVAYFVFIPNFPLLFDSRDEEEDNLPSATDFPARESNLICLSPIAFVSHLSLNLQNLCK